MAIGPDIENEVESLTNEAVTELRSIFRGREWNEQNMGVARLGASILASWVRMRQTRGSREALGFALARELAANPEELREYIRLTAPSISLPSKAALGTGGGR